MIRAGPDGQKTWYIYGLGLIGQENPDGSYQSYHYDYRGSTTAITNQNGEITDRIQYAAYGQLSYREGTTDTPFLYNGRDGVMSDTNGLYYMRARYYSPEILRFINQDILFGSIASPQSLNRYAYVNGQPVNYVDPFGLCREESKNDPFLDNLQNALDLMGMIPVAGEIFDAINAIIYLCRGDYGNAVLALLALIPVLGIVATGGKIALKTVIPKLITWLTGKLNDVPVIGGKILAKIKPVLEKLTGIACFPAGTLVCTKTGFKAIEDIQTGDQVYAENPQTGSKELKKVTRIFITQTRELVHIFVNGEEIKATPNHRFYVEKKGWVEAGELKAGDCLRLISGATALIEKIELEELSEPISTYNFEVEDWHSYYVSAQGV